jgi:RNA ligase
MVLNYTPKAVTTEWGKTLRRCRGLVYSDDLEIQSHGFEKFFNWGDPKSGPLPEGTPRVFEKSDGSYLSVFWYKNELVVNTRGSFESDQAKWANDWIRSHFTKKICSYSERELSFIFEVIIPEDRKVVDYDYSGLVLLGAVDRDGKEYSPECAEHYVSTWLKDYKVVKEYAYEDLETLQAKNIPNEEGYVCTWYQPEGPAFRVKLKFEEYKKLHKLIFNTNSWSIWELTKEGKCVTLILEGATEEIKSWANKLAKDIKQDHDAMKTAYTRAFRSINTLVNGACFGLDVSEKERRKTFAFYAKLYAHPELLFTLMDGRMDKFDSQVWELCKPVKTFFKREEP